MTAPHPKEQSPSEPVAAATPTLREVFEQHAAFVWRSLRYLGLSEADVEDAAQEVFLVVHRRLADYRERDRLRPWLYSICVRVSKAQRRRRAARPEQAWAEPPEVAEPAPQQRLIEHGEALRFGFQLLQSLPEKERAVFVLFELEQLPMSEIAAALECPVQTAYARLHRARERVRADVERASKRGELR